MQTALTIETARDAWPSLHYAEWKDTCETLHMWTQIVGKIRLELSPHVNHWWEVPLYVSARGLTTSPIPYGARIFEIEFDFNTHHLLVRDNYGAEKRLALQPMSVAEFYRELMELLDVMDLPVHIWPCPCEVAHPIHFDKDYTHASYDAGAVHRFWQILVQVDRVFKEFRARFIGKCSPVHFFWGSFDLAVTRFSGRPAPQHPPIPGVPLSMIIEAYSHEVCSVGFWPGGDTVDASFYSYAYPEPPGYREMPAKPAGAAFSTEMGEFLLPYEVIRTSPTPDQSLLDFCQVTYEAAADCGKWDRAALEK